VFFCGWVDWLAEYQFCFGLSCFGIVLTYALVKAHDLVFGDQHALARVCFIISYGLGLSQVALMALLELGMIPEGIVTSSV